jgi:hypothetical protein
MRGELAIAEGKDVQIANLESDLATKKWDLVNRNEQIVNLRRDQATKDARIQQLQVHAPKLHAWVWGKGCRPQEQSFHL